MVFRNWLRPERIAKDVFHMKIESQNTVLINRKTFQIFHDQRQFLANNQTILSISPGGFKGYYMMGTCAYIKEHYDISNMVFSGASAGAWNTLVMTFRGPTDDLMNLVTHKNITGAKSIMEMEKAVKNIILKTYTRDDFALEKIFIGMTNIVGGKPYTVIYHGFENLEDVLNACIASSHIPWITGNLTNIYNNMYSFDGGFSKYPYLNGSIFHITPSMWKNNTAMIVKHPRKIFGKIDEYTTLFSKSNYDLIQLYKLGYQDAELNRNILSSIFSAKSDE
jgi:hypothetical protein